MLSRVDPKDLQALAELEASRFGDLLRRVLRSETEKTMDALVAAEAVRVQRLQGRAEAFRDIAQLLDQARQFSRKQPT